jgi:hypothetical protein
MSSGPAASSSRSRPRSPAHPLTAIADQHVHIIQTIRILNGKLVVLGR